MYRACVETQLGWYETIFVMILFGRIDGLDGRRLAESVQSDVNGQIGVGSSSWGGGGKDTKSLGGWWCAC